MTRLALLIIAIAAWRWLTLPAERRRGKNHPPGYCYIMAGWVVCGQTKSGLVILEKLP